jgi:hypothetical protein
MVQHTLGGRVDAGALSGPLLIVDEEILLTLPLLSPPSALKTVTVFQSVFVGRYAWGGSNMGFMG